MELPGSDACLSIAKPETLQALDGSSALEFGHLFIMLVSYLIEFMLPHARDMYRNQAAGLKVMPFWTHFVESWRALQELRAKVDHVGYRTPD